LAALGLELVADRAGMDALTSAGTAGADVLASAADALIGAENALLGDAAAPSGILVKSSANFMYEPVPYSFKVVLIDGVLCSRFTYM
jgi:hypothetical protein